MEIMPLVLLGLLWVVYCFSHSFLVSVRFNDYLNSRFGFPGYYRLLYVIFSTVTIIPVFAFEEHIDSVKMIVWSGYFIYLKYLLVTYGAALFLLSVPGYDLLNFLGIRQLVQRKGSDSLAGDGFAEKGVHRFVRHPWYSALLTLLWARDLDSAALTTTICLTCYIFIGTRLEERKLVITFGEKYEDYQRGVSMLFPARWKKNS